MTVLPDHAPRRTGRCGRWRLALFAGVMPLVCVLGLLLGRDAQALDTEAAAALAPPARVGQLSLVSGGVRMRVDAASGWELAVPNTPITSGSAVATDIPGRAEVRIGSTGLQLGQDAQVVWTEISDHGLQLELRNGLAALRVRVLAPGEQVRVKVGGVTVQLLKPGAYRFRHVQQRARLGVWVLEGQARLAFNQQDITLGPKQQLQIDRELTTSVPASAGEDHESFDGFADVRDRRSAAAQSLDFVSAEMTGAEALDGHGSWLEEAGVGAVWFPRQLPLDWAPYRFGRWRWLAPWGWTWVDDAPWGFAPSHYGRWLFAVGRWGWAPGPLATGPAAARPVFAPALVGFYGTAASAVWVSSAAATPVVGWYPLAPGEVYWPAYNTPMGYVRALNASSLGDASALQALPAAGSSGPPNRFARTAFAATAMPYASFIAMQDVATHQVVLSPAALAQAPLSGRRLAPPPPKSP